MTVAEELDKLGKMLADGTITAEQYERARARLLEKGGDEEPPLADLDEPAEREERKERDQRRPRRYREDDYDEDYEEDEEYERRARRRRRRKKEVREWCMILHLSLFAGHAVPFGGIIAPIVLWQIKKDEMPEVDEHGRNAVNWVISNVIYLAISILLCFVFIGFPLLIVLAVLNIVFPIIAAMKAHEGRVWKYPLAIPFFS
jgi:uncharacterized Tic20 family protein